MRQLLRLLLYLAAGTVFYVPCTRSSYLESAPNCGYVQQDFVHFEQSPELEQEPTLGVCGWSFDNVPQLQSRLDLCVSCYFTPASQPTCRSGTVLVSSPEWHLAQRQDCAWQGCFMSDGTCSNGTVESSGGCDNGFTSLKCCPFKRFLRCCSMLTCTQRSAPAGQCVVGEKDLLPGQEFVSRVFAVNTASTDCYSYAFDVTRKCQSDRTFARGESLLYDSCQTLQAVGRDTEGCVKLAGYTFHQGWLLADPSNWRIDDGTQWDRLANPRAAREAAASDMPLMASRCSAVGSCVGFQSTGNSTDLLYQLPSSKQWVKVDDDSAAGRCLGIYEKSPPPSSCPRINGYLFISRHTLGTSASPAGFVAVAGEGPCSSCANATALASECDNYVGVGPCAGFSSYHGLIADTSSSSSSGGGGLLLSDQLLVQYTMTPCVGMYIRTETAFPSEVEQLDRLLCGELVYCTGQLRYHASGQSFSSGASASSTSSKNSRSSTPFYVDLSVDFLADFTLPRGLLDASGAGLSQLPTVRSLTLRCLNGSVLLGGLPVAVVALMPFLQELRVRGCGLTGPLPAQLSQLRYLRVLDLSNNALSGTLPDAWGNMSLGYLNLSSNRLTGMLPTSWRGILTAQPPAPPPPPPTPYSEGLPPLTPLVAAAEEPVSQQALLVADLSTNALEGPVDREYVYGSCVKEHVRMQLRNQPRTELIDSLGQGGVPTFLLQYNPGVAIWAGRYEFAVADLGDDLSGGSVNMCGASGYKIALGVLWGVFGICLLAIVSWAAWTAWAAARAAKRSQFMIAGVEEDTAAAAASDGAAAAATAGGASGGSSRILATLAWLWSKRWVRRVVFLLRLCYLAADVALDIAVAVWLFADGDTTSAAVCVAFLVAPQAAVSVALVVSLSHHFFASGLLVAALSPLLVAMGPVLGPVMALGNLRNPDVPLVFWRYLELVEFCVALLQAPAESVTQSIVYARQNLMGNGMYMNHALFLASIIGSLGDMLIAALKLCRYKRGPVRRVLVALTHLDKVRDPVDYRQRLLAGGSSTGNARDLRFGPGTGTSRFLETPLNPLPQPSLTGASRSHEASQSRTGATEPERQQHLTDSGAGTEPGGGYSPPEEQAGQGGAAAAAAAAVNAAAAAAAAAAVAHTFTPLTQPRYRPSLLATSSARLGGGAATSPGGPGSGLGGAGSSGGGGIAGLHSHSMHAPSRFGPAGGNRHSSVTIPAQPPLWQLVASPSMPARNAAELSGASTSAAGAGQTPHFATTSAPGPGSGADEGVGGGGSGSLSRRSRSLQIAMPPPPPPIPAQGALVGSISADVFGLAATGGHGPPPQQQTSAPGASGSSLVPGKPSRSVSGAAPGPSGAWPPAPPPPFGAFGDARSRATSAGGGGGDRASFDDGSSSGTYMASAAAAAAAALAEDEAVSAGAGPAAPGAPAPAGLLVSPGRSSSGGATPGPSAAGTETGPSPAAAASEAGPSSSIFRRAPSTLAEMRSGNVSPARSRREVPALSIAVPASPVAGQGIEVIRMSTPSTSLRHLSPETSRGAPTPVDWLPQPPRPQQPPRRDDRRTGSEEEAGDEEEG